MRIIAGTLRSRKLLSPPPTTRPTSDRTREAIFNIINNLNAGLFKNSCILDAFAGSGALGLEALSRGADHAIFIEKNPQAVHILKRNIIALGVKDSCTVITGDATQPPRASQPVHFIFLDPPYGQNLEVPCLTELSKQGWIDAHTLIILETSARKMLELPTSMTIFDQRCYGATMISFLKYLK